MERQKSDVFNILSSTQMDVSRHFFRKIEDKFADVAWAPGKHGVPLIDSCLTHFECDFHTKIDGSDHSILLFSVTNVIRFEGEPLLFSQDQYSIAVNHHAAQPTADKEGSIPITWLDETIVSQIFEVYHLFSSNFDIHRRAETVNASVAMVLTCLYDTPNLDIEQIERATYLGQRDTEEAVSTLPNRAMVVRSADNKLALTESGRQFLEAIGTRWKTFQQDQLARISEKDIRVTARTLSRLINQNKVSKT